MSAFRSCGKGKLKSNHNSLLGLTHFPMLLTCMQVEVATGFRVIDTLQIVPKGRKWTSAFRTCGGGYLKSNHIALLGLTRFGAARLPGQENDWTTAINIRFQRSKAVKNILSCDRHGKHVPLSK